MEFGLIFFSGDESNKYNLILESAKFADKHGFNAIWTPERHFHKFGGLYPNPSVISAAISMITKRIQIRSGSIIAPLHHPVRIAEEWSIVDNLSKGRVSISLATGFSPIDFIFQPDNWNNRREISFEYVETIRKLWRGESLFMKDGVGENTEVELFPRPISNELEIWLTCTKSEETFRKAGELGCNILTGLIDMSTEELEAKLQIYFNTLEEYGHDRSNVKVTMLLHTFIGEDEEDVRKIVKEPFISYLKTFFKVVDTSNKSVHPDKNVDNMSASDRESILNYGFEKFYNKGSLMGSPEKCMQVVKRMKGIGVTEIACLLDFGLDEDLVLKSLEKLNEFKNMNF
ncbi:MAG TPA: MupA/Atu3671 family FMN-dependent luciferase-like monooxygenase [Flavobacterium sp.]|uniref:MupA/Atu3671 family FMN-dependent luciferase-like monooxygenase n=1 Tax=Flavobacterium sp. TaxID=239 RepID=UPI0028E7C2EC|nr:MupA/Atu3671 family FMN-dependent luciferase-like monooxygenase [uncultured Flavobacterium sp.]